LGDEEKIKYLIMSYNYRYYMGIMLVFLSIGISNSQKEYSEVKATLIQHKKTDYGINELSLLMYPDLKSLVDEMIVKSLSDKCKLWIKLKIDVDTKTSSYQTIASDCMFIEEFNYKSYVENVLLFYVKSIDSDRDSIDITVPVNVLKRQD
ncbi:MAG: hypothetical protein AAGH46_13510, partial [Bacteroidota bacterium]